MVTDVIYHIAARTDWDRAQSAGSYEAPRLHVEGFIHCSTRAQVIPVANRSFRGRADLVLLRIRADQITAEIRYENAEDGHGVFPHVYGPLDFDAVIDARVLQPQPDGTFALPAGA